VESDTPKILTMNAGSSSIRFAVFDQISLARGTSGKIERIGMGGTMMSVVVEPGTEPASISVPDSDFGEALDFLLKWLGE
jgi:acetate kinase